MPHRILHLSDIHMTASGVDEDGVNAAAALDRLLHDCRHLTGLDAVVVTGDIADDGSAEGCALVRERVGQFAARRGIPHIYCTGNHDQRPAFSSALGTGPLNSGGLDVGVPLDGLEDECAAVSHVGGLRLITLDKPRPRLGTRVPQPCPARRADRDPPATGARGNRPGPSSPTDLHTDRTAAERGRAAQPRRTRSGNRR